MTRAKICGITRPEDAVLAERLGAWAVGFILVPNTKRYRPPQLAQLNGSEPPAWAEAVREHYPVIKAFKLSGPPDPALLAQALDYPCDALMVDGANPGSGQGYPLEWLEPFRGHPRLIVAGGLNPENLAPVLALRPYGVDVSSGVEQSPGVKDAQRVGDFLDLVSRLARR